MRLSYRWTALCAGIWMLLAASTLAQKTPEGAAFTFTETPRDIPLSSITTATASNTRMPQTAPGCAIDANAKSGWSCEPKLIKTQGPQWLQLELEEPCTVDALRYFLASTPQQDPKREYANWINRIQDYEVQVSTDGKEFKTVAAGTWDKKDLKEQRSAFDPIKTKFVRLVAKSADWDAASATEVRLESPAPPQPKAKPAKEPAKASASKPAAAQPSASNDYRREKITELPPLPVDSPRDIPHTRMKATATTKRNDYTVPEKAIDGNLEQGWLSEVGSLKTKGPQSLTLELDAVYTVDALRYFLVSKINTPRYANWMSRVQKYEIQASADGRKFDTVASGEWNKEDLKEQRVEFKPVQARFVRLTCFSADHDTAGVTEISLESPKPPAPLGIKVPPSKNADAHRKVFAERNSPAQQQQIAKSLYGLVNRQNPALKEYCALYEKGEYAAALRVFNKALIERSKSLREMMLSESGLGGKATLGISVEMMANIISGHLLPGKFDVGEPGGIDWNSPVLIQEMVKSGARVISAETFEPLLVKYQQTGDAKFLSKWGDYMDDMAMFYAGYSVCSSFDIADHDSWGSRRVREVLTEILAAELARPGIADKLSETTLPRLLLNIIPQNFALGATYFHANAQNWTPAAAVEIVRTALLLDDLIVQDVPLMEQALRLVERYEALSNFPDGTEVEQAMWYNWGYAEHLLDMLEDLEKTPSSSPLITAQWKTEAWETVLRRLRFSCQIFTQQGQWPLFLRGDNRHLFDMAAMTMTPSSTTQQRKLSPLIASPTILRDPCIKQMLDMIGPDKQSSATLPFTSNYFPWAGYRVIRENWNPDSQYASMFSSPHPGKYWARGGSDQLNLGIHAFGKDLLVDDAKGHYSGFSSPLMVDGKNQIYRAGFPRWGHKQLLQNAWKNPDTSRWISSDTFDFMEGTYSGPYGDHGKGQPADIVKENKEAIRGITHQRQVIFVRQAGLWIATDRLTSDKPHDYTWRWILPCIGKKENYFAFLPAEIKINDAEKTITTAKPDGVNLTMRTFAATALKYKRAERSSAEYEHYGKMDNPWNKVCEITALAKAQQNLLAITPILPRKNQRDDFKSLAPSSSDNSEGFIAVTPDGAKVMYAASRKGTAALACGPVKADAEALLSVEKDGRVTGLALGCKSLALNGAAAKLPGADFTFEAGGKALAKTSPILRPVELVEIQPARNVFMAEETISMSCPTEGVEIRYTTDGAEPSRASKLYAHPFKISDSARIKARAFRPGLQEAAGELNFTHASPETLAVFTRQTPAAPVQPAATQPGLHYAYYEGDWQKLLLNTNLLEPTGTGVVPAALDISPRKTKGRFTFVYEGYIDVPADGVYTFHAPFEYYDNKIDNGYDLVLQIDGTRWYPSTRRHALGNWSVTLAKGKHAFRLKYLDYRGDTVVLCLPGEPELPNPIQIDYKAKGNPPNFPGMNGNYVWGGGVPELLISGGGIEKQPIPSAWLFSGK